MEQLYSLLRLPIAIVSYTVLEGQKLGRKILIFVAVSAQCVLPCQAQTVLPLTPGTTVPAVGLSAENASSEAPAAAAIVTDNMPTAAAPQKLTLPAATVVFVTIDKDLSTQEVMLGDHFDVTLEKDVMFGDAVAIPAGTKGVGEINFVTKKGGFGKPGILGLALKHLNIGDKSVALVGRYREEGGNNNGGAAATMFAVGILAIAVTGKQATIPAGRSLKARTGEDYVFDVPPVAANRVAEGPAADATITNSNTVEGETP